MKRRTSIAQAGVATLGLLILPACGPAATGSGGPTSPEVDAIFADLQGDRPGAAVGVVWNGEVVHRAGYGTAHLDHGVPITPETVFDIASISKQFGALAALLLESEGDLDLDADVRGYVPELPDFGAVVTARHLIHHTSGIRDWPHTMALGGIGFTDVISFEKILRMLYRQQAINFPPGSEYAYSNTGYNLLARVIEVQSGMTFREYTESRIFGPLGMTRTHFSDDHLEVVPGRAESYAPAEGGEGFRRMPNQLTALASSSLHTTMDDFIRWMRNYETGQVGGEAMLRTMVQPGVLTNGEALDYAHGLSVTDYRGLPTFGHGGSWVGYRTNFVRFPEQNLSIAVFCQRRGLQPRRAGPPGGRGVHRRPHGPRTGSLRARAVGPQAPTDRRPVAGVRRQLPQPRARQHLPPRSRCRRPTRGHPLAQRPKHPLEPTGADTFRGDQWFLPEVRFLRDNAARITGFTVTGTRVRNLIFDSAALNSAPAFGTPAPPGRVAQRLGTPASAGTAGGPRIAEAPRLDEPAQRPEARGRVPPCTPGDADPEAPRPVAPREKTIPLAAFTARRPQRPHSPNHKRPDPRPDPPLQNLRLVENPPSKSGVKRRLGHHVHAPPQQILNVHQERTQRQPGASSGETHEQIHIAELIGVVAHHRTEDAHLPEPMLFGKGTDFGPP